VQSGSPTQDLISVWVPPPHRMRTAALGLVLGAVAGASAFVLPALPASRPWGGVGMTRGEESSRRAGICYMALNAKSLMKNQGKGKGKGKGKGGGGDKKDGGQPQGKCPAIHFQPI
jgi:hypothetical protein